MSGATPIDHIASLPKPKVTVLFENDTRLFTNPSWNAFYSTCIRWVNEATLEHGDGFSIKFSMGYTTTRACVRWKNKSLWLFYNDPRIVISLQEGAASIDTVTLNDAWQDVLTLLIQNHRTWKVMRLRRELAEAEAALAADSAEPKPIQFFDPLDY